MCCWGKLLSINDTSGKNVGAINPFRYRGYYYDTETGLYYLQSRYYDPNTGRFLNADTISTTVEQSHDLLSTNLFAYCTNNPVNHFDSDGTWKLPNWAKIAIGVAAIGIAVGVTAATGGAAAPVLIASLQIAATSAASSAAINVCMSVISTRSFKGAGRAALDGACDGFMWGGIAAGATFSVAAARGIKIRQIGRLKPSNKRGKGNYGVKYKNKRGSLKSFEIHSPHKSGPHQKWHWQKNTWNPKTNGITGSSKHWTLYGRRF